MNNSYLEKAKEIIKDPKELSTVVSKRAKQLALGARPMVRCQSENFIDVAMLEIVEGKLSFDYTDGTEEENDFVKAAEAAAEAAAAELGESK